MAFSALAAGVSGLQAFSEGIGVIADNITNVNTVGYKETRSRFSTLVTETNAITSYSPGGVRGFSDTLVSRQGLLQPSASPTDIAVDGAGFFVVRDADNANDQTGELLFTRAGSFQQDPEGFLRNTAGLALLGWPVDSQGNLPVNLNDPSELQPINVNQFNGLAQATTSVAIEANLQGTGAVNTAYATAIGAGGVGAMARNNDPTTTTNAATPDFETNVQIFDSQGRAITVNFGFAKTAANTWALEVYAADPTQLDGTNHPNGLIANGEISFNTDGTLDLGNSQLFQGNTATTDVLGSGAGIDITFDNSVIEVDTASVVFDFGTDGLRDGLTQGVEPSALSSSNVDGAAFGGVDGIRIDENGDVFALFENGLFRNVFKLPVATLPNPDGMQRRQGNAFAASDSSGDFSFIRARTGGAGRISPNSLEQSTVDLANEFAELIKVQRAFSASTRIITTSDEVLEELTRLI